MDFAVAQMEKLETHARKMVCINVVIGRRLLMSFEFFGGGGQLLCRNVYNYALRVSFLLCFLWWESYLSKILNKIFIKILSCLLD